MLLTSSGIVFYSVKYGENSLISKVLSKEKGLLSLISNRSKGKKNKQANFFQPLSAIDFVCYLSSKSAIHRLKEITFNSSVHQFSDDISLNALRFFLAEFLSKVIKEEEQNFRLYEFIENQIRSLSTPEIELGNFHLSFLIDLLDQLGIRPELHQNHSYFDLIEGCTVPLKPKHSDFYEKKQVELLIAVSEKNYSCNKIERISLLNLLISYYHTQLGGGLDNLKSKAVLEMVFN